jgi:hypothetical protein
MTWYDDDGCPITEQWWAAVVEPNLPEFDRWGGLALEFSETGGVIMRAGGDQGDDMAPALTSHYLNLDCRGDVRHLVRFLFGIDLPGTPLGL